MDIVVANSHDDNIGILLGYGNDSFTNQRTYSTGVDSKPYSVAVSDFNHDKKLDFVVVKSHYSIQIFFCLLSLF